MLLARDDGASTGLPGIIRRASFLGAQVDYLIDIAGTLVRAALPSHECLARNLLFVEGDRCCVELATVQWFVGNIVAGERA